MAIKLTKVIALHQPFVSGVGGGSTIPSFGSAVANGSILFRSRMTGGIQLKADGASPFGTGPTSFKITVKAAWTGRSTPGVLYQFGTPETPSGVVLAVNKVSGVDKFIFCVATGAGTRFVATCTFPSKTGLIQIEVDYDASGNTVVIKYDGTSQTVATTGTYVSGAMSGPAALATAMNGCILANITGVSSAVIGTGWISIGNSVNTLNGRIGGFTYTPSLSDNAETVMISFERNSYLPYDTKGALVTTTRGGSGDISWVIPKTGLVSTLPHVPAGIMWLPEQSRLRQKDRLRNDYE